MSTHDEADTVEVLYDVGAAVAFPVRSEAVETTPVVLPQVAKWKLAERSYALKRLGFKRYEDYLDSEHWQMTRDDFVKRRSRFCAVCGRPADDIHHCTYEHIGDEQDGELVWLCREHHAKVTSSACWDFRKPMTAEQRKLLVYDHVTDNILNAHNRVTASLAINDSMMSWVR